MTKLFIQEATGEYVPATDDQIRAAALALTDKLMRRGPALQNSRILKEHLMVRVSHLPYEVFGMVLVDARLSVLDVVELFRGTIDGAAVYPREVVRQVLEKNATSVILFHNHPSGVPEPSDADKFLTNQLKASLALIDVRVLDHLVVGHDFVESFAERGLI